MHYSNLLLLALIAAVLCFAVAVTGTWNIWYQGFPIWLLLAGSALYVMEERLKENEAAEPQTGLSILKLLCKGGWILFTAVVVWSIYFSSGAANLPGRPGSIVLCCALIGGLIGFFRDRSVGRDSAQKRMPEQKRAKSGGVSEETQEVEMETDRISTEGPSNAVTQSDSKVPSVYKECSNHIRTMKRSRVVCFTVVSWLLISAPIFVFFSFCHDPGMRTESCGFAAYPTGLLGTLTWPVGVCLAIMSLYWSIKHKAVFLGISSGLVAIIPGILLLIMIGSAVIEAYSRASKRSPSRTWVCNPGESSCGWRLR